LLCFYLLGLAEAGFLFGWSWSVECGVGLRVREWENHVLLLMFLLSGMNEWMDAKGFILLTFDILILLVGVRLFRVLKLCG